jgi:uncharacterized delta-60 repeat protein
MPHNAQLAPRIVAALLMGGLALPAVAHSAPVVQKAPGRVVFSVDSGAVQRNVDAGGAYIGVALPGGATLMIGGGAVGSTTLYAAKVGLDGALDPSFGTAGVRSFPAPPNSQFGAVSVVRQPDGKLLLISLRRGASGLFGNEKVQVTRLNADMSLDGSYGVGGTALTAIGGISGAVLQPDGRLVLSGTTGEITTAPAPGEPAPLRWAVARLMPDGAVDAGFGTGGVTTITPTVSSSGANVAIGPGGTIVAEGQAQTALTSGSQSRMLLARLTPGGLPDPAFAGGVPVATPFASGRTMLVQDDGSVVVSGQTQNPGTSITSQVALRPHYLARYTPAGAIDPAFGIAGVVDLGKDSTPNQLLPSAGNAMLVVGAPAYGLAPGSGPTGGRLIARLVGPNGAIVQTRTVDMPFGGGGSSFIGNVRPRPLTDIKQNTFLAETVVRRSDGSYIVPGGVHVSQPTGEGVGFSIGRFAAAGLTPGFSLDTSFGGPATAPKLSLRLSLQRARSAYTRHGIRVSLKSSAVGLARVRIKHGNRLIAQSLLPVFKTTRHTLLVGNTKYGNTYLRHHRNVRVTISATGRDLLTSTDTATARGRLR